MSRISVIIPTYQHASTIAQALDSLLAQSRKPDEVIVCDDGSTDATKKVIAPYLAAIDHYSWEPNQGAPAARNRGFKRSTGDLVIFWDADVVARPDMLEKLEAALAADHGASWCYSSFWWGKRLFRGRPFNAQALRAQNYIHTTSLIRREAFPGFDENLARFQDWDLWLTMSEQGHRGVFVDEPLYRVLLDPKRHSYSRWLPRMAYRVPWPLLGWAPGSIVEHQAAREVIARKHGL